MKVRKGLALPVVALPCVGHMPGKDGDERVHFCGDYAGYADVDD